MKGKYVYFFIGLILLLLGPNQTLYAQYSIYFEIIEATDCAFIPACGAVGDSGQVPTFETSITSQAALDFLYYRASPDTCPPFFAEMGGVCSCSVYDVSDGNIDGFLADCFISLSGDASTYELLVKTDGTFSESINITIPCSCSNNGIWYVSPDEPDIITLAAFTANPGNKQVTLEWSTESEVDNAGINIYRAESEDGDYVQINDALIPAEGSPTEGASYEFTDEDVQNRKTYWYQLEDVDLNGVATMHGPESATPRLIYGILK